MENARDMSAATVLPSPPLEPFVFVTVGSTQFDKLVRSVDVPGVYAQLEALGFQSVVFQIGKGSYVPASAELDGQETIARGDTGNLLPVQVFRRAPSIEEYLKTAGLVISHAGVGTIMETLRIGSPLIAVVNPSLMDDHQLEVCLALDKYIRTCRSPDGISKAIEAGPREIPYPKLDNSIFPNLLENELEKSLRVSASPCNGRCYCIVYFFFVSLGALWITSTLAEHSDMINHLAL